MSHNRRSRKLFDALTNFDGELQNALFTTYNFDSDYFEGILLPKLLDVGVDEQEDSRLVAIDLVHKLRKTGIFVIADGKVNKSIKKGLFGYDLVPIFKNTQHAKIFILQFENSFRLILGSANLTESGIHRNKEVYVEFDLHFGSDHWEVFFDVLSYLELLSVAGENQKLNEMLRAWRRQATSMSADSRSEGPQTIRFVGVSPTAGKLSFRGLLDSFLRAHKIEDTGKRRVDEIYVMSPFFEEEQGLNPNHSKTLLYKEYYDLKEDQRFYPAVYIYLPTQGDNINCLFPQKSYKKLCDELQDKFVVLRNGLVSSEGKQEVVRFPHGKLYVIRNFNGYMMTVIGSSNFSPSGFGSRKSGESNWEANLAIFSPDGDARDAKALFPKDDIIKDEIWQSLVLNDDKTDQNPEDHDNDLIVLIGASFIEGKLSLKSIEEQPQKYDYYIGDLPIQLIWVSQSGICPDSEFKGVSVEVRSRSGLIIQDIPIQFLDDSYNPVEMNISKQDFVDWIESRYLHGRQMPLSGLLEKFARKKSYQDEREILGKVLTDDYLIYRVKSFNELVSKIFDVLSSTRNFPKRVEYHLISHFGISKCIDEYFVQASVNIEMEVFCLYQAVEVVSSVLSAFEHETNPDILRIVKKFWDGFLNNAKAFTPQSAARSQLEVYLEAVEKLADGVLKTKELKVEVSDVAV